MLEKELKDYFPNASASFRKLNFEKPKIDLTISETTRQKKCSSKEAVLQLACEAWLYVRGYRRRTPENIKAHTDGKWFLHFHRTRGNPIVLDFILLDAPRGRYIEIELKVQGGRVSPEQRALIGRGEGTLCWNIDDFRKVVCEWEREIDEENAEKKGK